MHRDFHKKVKPISYEPISVRELLTRMKTYSELMLDLAYSAILFSSPALSEWVMELEEEVDRLGYLLLMSLSLSVRDKEDAELAVGLFRVAASADKISDAAADLAELAQRPEQVHPLIQHMFKYVEEHLIQARVLRDSDLIGISIQDLWDTHNINTDVIAVRRNRLWTVNPDRTWVFGQDDVIFVRGSHKEVGQVLEMATGVEELPAEDEDAEPEDSFERLLLEIKETSEFMVSLGFAAVKYQDSELAKEVGELEESIDRQCEIAIREVLALDDVDTPLRLGLIGFIVATEQIADAAWEMAAVQLSGLETHPVIAAIVDEAEEIVSRVTIHPNSPLVEKTLREAALDDNYGIYVLSVRREKHWFHRPSGSFRLRGGDVLVFDGYREGLEEIRQVAGSNEA